MGRIRKTLAIGSVVATGGIPIVRWNSSAEKAAKKAQELMREQNRLLTAHDAGNGSASGQPSPKPASRKPSSGRSTDPEWRADHVPGSKEYRAKHCGRS